MFRKAFENEEICFSETVKLYKNLQICNVLFRNAMSPIYLPVSKMGVSAIVIVSMFALIVFNRTLDLPSIFVFSSFGSCCALTFFFFVGMASLVSQKSQKLLSLLAHRARTDEEKMMLKSIHVLHGYVGNYFRYNRATLLTVYRYNIETTINFIIMYR